MAGPLHPVWLETRNFSSNDGFLSMGNKTLIYLQNLLEGYNKNYPQSAGVRHLEPIIIDDKPLSLLTPANIVTLETYETSEKHKKTGPPSATPTPPRQ